MAQHDEIERLKQAIAAQEALRGILPDEQIETALRALRAQLARYQAEMQGSGAVAQGDESMAVGQRAVGVGGNVEHAFVNTGVIYAVYRSAPGIPHLNEDAFQRMLANYLDWVQKAYGKARLYGLESVQAVGEKPKRQLADVFVPLALQRFSPPRRAEIEALAQKLGGDPWAQQKAFLQLVESRRGEGEKIDLADLLTLHNRLAVIGGAGSGKSTLLAYLAASLAAHVQNGQPLAFNLPKGRTALFPIVVPLRYRQEYQRLVEHAPQEVLTRAHPGTLAGFILWYLMKRSQAVRVADEALAEDFFDRLLRGGGCLVMLDGLDEVTSNEARGQVRAEVEKLAEEIYPDNLFIVTARESGYKENAIFSDDFLRLDVLPLEDDQIHALVENWCRQLYPEQVEAATDEIMSAIREINARYQRQKLPRLIRTPLMTTMVVSVKWGETELPRERARLYEAVIKVILQAQYLDDDPTRSELINWGGPWEEQRDWLSHLALAMHRGGQAGAAIDEARLREILREQLASENLEQFIRAVRSRGGVLEEKAGLFQFAHLTFQEFLAARLLAKMREASLKNLASHVDDPWWRETLLLLYGFAKMDYAPFAERYLHWLSHELPPASRLAGRELAAAAVLEIERPLPELRRRQGEYLAQALEDPALEARPKTRARAGDTLAALGDPRFDFFPPRPLGEGMGVRALLPTRRWALERRAWADESTLGFVRIPAGPFLMGSDPQRDPEAYDDEQPQHEVTLPYDYWIARYPVTVAQWRAFVEATGYDDFVKRALRDPENHPVRWITWHNALAYARWLDGVLRAVAKEALQEARRRMQDARSTLQAEEAVRFWEALASGKYHVTLPSEAEWEKAARGPRPSPFGRGDGGEGVRVYPWGDEFTPDHANTEETGLGTTSAVGAFPHGASPYGVLDLSGNVWEWTRSLWGENWRKPDYGYPYDLKDGREDLNAPWDTYRVLRGGSWLNDRGYARAAFRSRYVPSYFINYLGFRVVFSLAKLGGGAAARS